MVSGYRTGPNFEDCCRFQKISGGGPPYPHQRQGDTPSRTLPPLVPSALGSHLRRSRCRLLLFNLRLLLQSFLTTLDYCKNMLDKIACHFPMEGVFFRPQSGSSSCLKVPGIYFYIQLNFSPDIRAMSLCFMSLQGVSHKS